MYKHLKWIFPIRRLKDILTKITVFCHEAARLSHFSLSCHRHLSKKNRCQTDTDSWHTPVPDTFQEDVGNSGEIKWGDCWTSNQGGTGGQNELLLLFQFADHYSLPPTWCKTAASSKWERYFEDCILESGLCVCYLVTSLCMDGAKDKAEQGIRVQRHQQ